MIYVPYPGVTPAIGALVGEHLTSVFSTYPAVAEQIKAGILRPLAAVSATRIAALPDVPTLAETGYKDLDGDLWYGLFAPTKTPKISLAQLATWFTAALHAPEIKPKLLVQGLLPVAVCGDDFVSFVRSQYEKYGHGIRATNIKVE